MRAPEIRGFSLRQGEIAVDNFAGGGGASTGIAAGEMAQALASLRAPRHRGAR